MLFSELAKKKYAYFPSSRNTLTFTVQRRFRKPTTNKEKNEFLDKVTGREQSFVNPIMEAFQDRLRKLEKVSNPPFNYRLELSVNKDTGAVNSVLHISFTNNAAFDHAMTFLQTMKKQ